MRIVAYSNLNGRNKARIDTATHRFNTPPKVAHHSIISSKVTKHIHSMITVSDPSTEIQLVLGAGKFKLTKIALDR